MHDSVIPFDPIDVIVLLRSLTDRMLCYPPFRMVMFPIRRFGHDD